MTRFTFIFPIKHGKIETITICKTMLIKLLQVSIAYNKMLQTKITCNIQLHNNVSETMKNCTRQNVQIHTRILNSRYRKRLQIFKIKKFV